MRHLLPLLCAMTLCCTEERTQRSAPVYEGDVASLLEKRCRACHSPDEARGGVVLADYLATLACARDADAGPDEWVPGSALLAALTRSDHASLLSASERARLRAWVDSATPLRSHGVHAPGILSPRSADWHGRLAARDQYGPLHDPSHPDVCGRCHAGAPATPKAVTRPAPGAPACTKCHEQTAGVLACGTCHGDGAARAHPPRDPCLFGGPAYDAHTVHVTSTQLWTAPLACTDCHPSSDPTFGSTHADGRIQVTFATARAGDAASFDADLHTCAVRCHARGGAREQPSFREPGPLACGDCHGTPPAEHYAGPCQSCHGEINAAGTALLSLKLHLNGEVDFGAGGQRCGACHGQGDDPMPATGAHALHRASQLTAAIRCSDCHAVPDTVASSGHLDRGARTPADVSFGERASARGQAPSYESGTCSAVACHGAGLPGTPPRAFAWGTPPEAASCVTCHAIPRPPPHPREENCAAVICHGAEVSVGAPSLGITDSGRGRHIDGLVQHGAP